VDGCRCQHISGMHGRGIDEVNRGLSAAAGRRVAVLSRHPQDGVVQLRKMTINAIRIAEIKCGHVHRGRDGRRLAVVMRRVKSDQVAAVAAVSGRPVCKRGRGSGLKFFEDFADRNLILIFVLVLVIVLKIEAVEGRLFVILALRGALRGQKRLLGTFAADENTGNLLNALTRLCCSERS